MQQEDTSQTKFTAPCSVGFRRYFVLAAIAGLLTGQTLVRYYLGSGLLHFQIVSSRPFFSRGDDQVIAVFLAVLGGLILGAIMYNARGRIGTIIALGSFASPFNTLLIVALMALDAKAALLILSVGLCQTIVALILDFALFGRPLEDKSENT